MEQSELGLKRKRSLSPDRPDKRQVVPPSASGSSHVRVSETAANVVMGNKESFLKGTSPNLY